MCAWNSYSYISLAGDGISGRAPLHEQIIARWVIMRWSIEGTFRRGLSAAVHASCPLSAGGIYSSPGALPRLPLTFACAVSVVATIPGVNQRGQTD